MPVAIQEAAAAPVNRDAFSEKMLFIPDKMQGGGGANPTHRQANLSGYKR